MICNGEHVIYPHFVTVSTNNLDVKLVPWSNCISAGNPKGMKKKNNNALNANLA